MVADGGPAEPAARSRRSEGRSLRLFAALLPLTVGGFGMSAVADRPIFLLWAAICAAAFAAASRPFAANSGAEASGAGRIARRLPALVLIAAWAGLAALGALYAEDLREGLVAHLPAGSAPVSTFFLLHDSPVPGALRDIPGTLGGLS